VPLFASRGVERRPDPPEWQTNDVPVIAGGTALWAVALVVLLVLRLAGVDGVRDWWLALCACGAVLGLVGVRYVARLQARRAARAD
jgi:hypothetical protein